MEGRNVCTPTYEVGVWRLELPAVVVAHHGQASAGPLHRALQPVLGFGAEVAGVRRAAGPQDLGSLRPRRAADHRSTELLEVVGQAVGQDVDGVIHDRLHHLRERLGRDGHRLAQAHGQQHRVPHDVLLVVGVDRVGRVEPEQVVVHLVDELRAVLPRQHHELAGDRRAHSLDHGEVRVEHVVARPLDGVDGVDPRFTQRGERLLQAVVPARRLICQPSKNPHAVAPIGK